VNARKSATRVKVASQRIRTAREAADPRSLPPSMRQRILDAAFSIFAERGYSGTSTLEIAKRAKVSKRELYAQFRNKEALFAAGIEANAPLMRISADLPAVTDREELAAALKVYGAMTLSRVSDQDVLAAFRLAIAESVTSPELARALNRFGRDANRRILAEILSQARSHKLIANDDMSALAEEFLGLLWGSLLTELLLQTRKQPTAKEINRRVERAVVAFLILHDVEAN
jgi:AcrR family transcriptional regulator